MARVRVDLPQPALAHEAEAFALVQVEGHAVDGDDGRAAAEAHPPAGIGAGDVSRLDQGVGARGAASRSGAWEEAARSARV
jgi:hypothetical protein